MYVILNLNLNLNMNFLDMVTYLTSKISSTLHQFGFLFMVNQGSQKQGVWA